MDRLNSIKALVDLRRIRLQLESENEELASIVEGTERCLSAYLGLSLEPSATTPKQLYGKPYSELTQDELNEYTQIKRALKRGK